MPRDVVYIQLFHALSFLSAIRAPNRSKVVHCWQHHPSIERRETISRERNNVDGKTKEKIAVPSRKKKKRSRYTHTQVASKPQQPNKEGGRGRKEMRVPNGLLTIELEEREVFWKGEWHLFPSFFASCVRQSQTCKPPFTTTVNKEQHPSSNKASPFSLPLPQTALLSSLLLLRLLIAIFHLAPRRTEASTPVALLQKRKREEALNSRAKKSRSRPPPSLPAPNAKLLFAVTQILF